MQNAKKIGTSFFFFFSVVFQVEEDGFQLRMSSSVLMWLAHS